MNELLTFLRHNFIHAAPILLVGGIALAITIERVRALMLVYPLKSQDRFFEKLKDYVMADKLVEAIALCDRYRTSLVPNVVREGLLRGHQPEAMVADGLELAVSEAVAKVTKRTQFLSTIANVSTLLGLFGTIVGLIKSFTAVGAANAQLRAAMLAEGISTAMNATMLGLGVAIPCMLAFSYLMNRSNRLNTEIEQSAIRVLDMLKQRFYAAELETSNTSNQRTV